MEERWLDMSEEYDGSQPMPEVNDSEFVVDRVLGMIEDRKAFGIRKYGTALQPGNGRDMLQDLIDELMDALIYAVGLQMEGEQKIHTFNKVEYDHIALEEGPQAQRLAEYLWAAYQPATLIDVGCANGLYIKPFLELGVAAQGYEISEDALVAPLVNPALITIRDMTEPTALRPQKFNLALCLEVLEHVPEDQANAFIYNLCKLSDRIVFSAAIPGQGGRGHINCQHKDYWMKLFELHGFTRQLDEESAILDHMRKGYHMGWLTQNLMVFTKNG